MKKIFSIILSAILCWALVFTSFAAVSDVKYYVDENGDAYIFGNFEADDTDAGIEVNGQEYSLTAKNMFWLAKLQKNRFGICLTDPNGLLPKRIFTATPYAINADGEKVYTDSITIDMDDPTGIGSDLLAVSFEKGSNIVPKFNKNITEYKVIVEDAGVIKEPTVKVSNGASYEFSSNENVATIKVTSGNKVSEKTYTFNFESYSIESELEYYGTYTPSEGEASTVRLTTYQYPELLELHSPRYKYEEDGITKVAYGNDYKNYLSMVYNGAYYYFRQIPAELEGAQYLKLSRLNTETVDSVKYDVDLNNMTLKLKLNKSAEVYYMTTKPNATEQGGLTSDLYDSFKLVNTGNSSSTIKNHIPGENDKLVSFPSSTALFEQKLFVPNGVESKEFTLKIGQENSADFGPTVIIKYIDNEDIGTDSDILSVDFENGYNIVPVFDKDVTDYKVIMSDITTIPTPEITVSHGATYVTETNGNVVSVTVKSGDKLCEKTYTFAFEAFSVEPELVYYKDDIQQTDYQYPEKTLLHLPNYVYDEQGNYAAFGGSAATFREAVSLVYRDYYYFYSKLPEELIGATKLNIGRIQGADYDNMTLKLKLNKSAVVYYTTSAVKAENDNAVLSEFNDQIRMTFNGAYNTGSTARNTVPTQAALDTNERNVLSGNFYEKTLIVPKGTGSKEFELQVANPNADWGPLVIIKYID